MLAFATFTMASTLIGRETFHPGIMRRRSRELGLTMSPSSPPSMKLKISAMITLFRPIQMLLTEPIVTFICLYMACEFATLFSFFAAVPLVFQGIYRFGLDESGLVFLSIVVGCLFGTITVLLCDICLYRRKAINYQGRQVPPELRLYPSLIGKLFSKSTVPYLPRIFTGCTDYWVRRYASLDYKSEQIKVNVFRNYNFGQTHNQW